MTNSDSTYKTKATKIVIIVQDGVRYTEGFGDSTLQYLPFLKTLLNKGTLLTNFYNNGTTNTINGCSAAIAGNYSSMPNNIDAVPAYPNILNYYLYCKNLSPYKACIFSSKDKIETLAKYSDSSLILPTPFTNCGVSGNGSGYRNDTTTFYEIKKYVNANRPDVLFITFKEPDASAHTGDWQKYISGIKLTDSLIVELYNYFETLEDYKNKTNYFITNDHGRHLDSFGGFTHHGDGCMGCKHISLLALGADIKTNTTITNSYELIDIPRTIAYLLKVKMKYNNGIVIKEMLK